MTSTGGKLPEPRLYAVAVECQGSIFVVGGISKAGDHTTASNTFWKWDPEASQSRWKELPPLPGLGRAHHAVAEMGGRLYVFGEATADIGGIRNLDDVYEFDPKSGEWATFPRLPIARRAWWGVGTRTKILLLGGFTDAFSAEVFEYDPTTQTLEACGVMPHGLADTKFFLLGPWLIGVGGEAADKIRGQWTLQLRMPAEWVRGSGN